MFSILGKDGKPGIRLSKEDREIFIKKYDSNILQQYGHNMPEYVELSTLLLKKTKEMIPYHQKGLEYVTSIKPKQTKK